MKNSSFANKQSLILGDFPVVFPDQVRYPFRLTAMAVNFACKDMLRSPSLEQRGILFHAAKAADLDN